MAKQVITLLTDDIDRSDADRTVEFAMDGVTYTIDLSEKNIGKLRKALDPYIAAGTRVTRAKIQTRGAGRGSEAAHGRADRRQNQTMREWAAQNGYTVSARGRIPTAVADAFHNQK